MKNPIRMSVPSGIRTGADPASNPVILSTPLASPLAYQVFNNPIAEEKGEDASKEKDPPEDCFGHGSTSWKRDQDPLTIFVSKCSITRDSLCFSQRSRNLFIAERKWSSNLLTN